jgi:hypothetical protein
VVVEVLVLVTPGVVVGPSVLVAPPVVVVVLVEVVYSAVTAGHGSRVVETPAVRRRE